jgi:hypothetical protein
MADTIVGYELMEVFTDGNTKCVCEMYFTTSGSVSNCGWLAENMNPKNRANTPTFHAEERHPWMIKGGLNSNWGQLISH